MKLIFHLLGYILFQIIIFEGQAVASEVGQVKCLPMCLAKACNRINATFNDIRGKLFSKHGNGGKDNNGICSDRLQSLKDIVSNGGSVQSYDAMSYNEYKNLSQLQLTADEMQSYSSAMTKLLQRQKEFKAKYPQISKANVVKTVKKGLPDEAKNSDKPLHAMVIESKNVTRLIYSETGEGSWLDIFSFIKSGVKTYQVLANIFELSTIQSPELDTMVNALIHDMHEANKPIKESKGKSYKKAVVVGAGPNGLYSALLFYMEGIDVTILNERGERYLRNQIVDLDTKWAVQLRFILGTHFDELFIGEDALGKFVEDGHYLQINTKNFEDVMKERLSCLASYVLQKTGDETHFRLMYETAFKEIRFPTSNDSRFYAVLEAPTKPSPDVKKFNENLASQRTVQLAKSTTINYEESYKKAIQEIIEEKLNDIITYLEKKYKRTVKPDEPIIDRKGKKVTPRQQAEDEFWGKACELRDLTPIEFDLLICNGGVNDDACRNKYLGRPKEETVPKSYGVAVYLKGSTYKKQNFLIPGKSGRVTETYANLQPKLEAQKFDELLKKSDKILPSWILKKYSNLTEMMVKGLVSQEIDASREDTQYLEDKNGKFLLSSEDPNQRLIQLRLFENSLTFYVGAETTEALAELAKDMEKAKKERPDMGPQITKLKSQFDRKWFTAIAYRFIEDLSYPELKGKNIININTDGTPGAYDSEKINFDPIAINTSTFLVIQFALEIPAKSFKKSGGAAIVMALGDSRASPHFFSGSGISTGRMSTELSVILLREHNHTLVDVPLEDDYGYELLCDKDVTPDDAKFRIKLSTTAVFEVSVTADGDLRIGDEVYSTFVEVVIALKH